MNNNKLFEQFPPVSTQEWMDKIVSDLKGADFNKKLVWRTGEGFDVKPFYREEDTAGLPFLESLPGHFPYLRGIHTANNTWLVRQDVEVSDSSAANRKALDVLMKGVDSLGFILPDAGTAGKHDFETLLKDIYLESIEVNFTCAGNHDRAVAILCEIVSERGLNPADIRGAVEADPLGRLLTDGSLCTPVEDSFDSLASMAVSAAAMPNLQTVCFNASVLSNSGAGVVAELGYALSAGSEYMLQLTARGIDAGLAASKIKFCFGTGPDYFMEIAKLRAARLLWSLVLKGFAGESCAGCAMNIHSVTNRWNKTVYDPHVNMLRTQTEAMSAIIGGADSVTVEPFDIAFRTPGEFSERIARNQQLILKEEAFFDKVADPAGGSYYIESLTHSIAENAWKLFVETEEYGGFLEALKAGRIRKDIETAAVKRKKDTSTGRLKLLGTNHFPDTKPSPEGLDAGRAFGQKTEVDCAGIKPVAPFRVSEEIEKLRIAVEKAGRKPVVFLFTIGNQAMRKARAQFAMNFFGCAGYKIAGNAGFDSVEEGINAAVESQADIAVICSSDDEYRSIAPEIYNALSGKMLVVVAGNPTCIDELKSKGLELYIHVKSDMVETLRFFNSRLL
ncbi:MAG: methylmalonyl-CoA mutase family protein [Bacteroidales bacterium]|nr:methylmalonyl-CoA mutase family protein [Bacteroidales bacterium]